MFDACATPFVAREERLNPRALQGRQQASDADLPSETSDPAPSEGSGASAASKARWRSGMPSVSGMMPRMPFSKGRASSAGAMMSRQLMGSGKTPPRVSESSRTIVAAAQSEQALPVDDVRLGDTAAANLAAARPPAVVRPPVVRPLVVRPPAPPRTTSPGPGVMARMSQMVWSATSDTIRETTVGWRADIYDKIRVKTNARLGRDKDMPKFLRQSFKKQREEILFQFDQSLFEPATFKQQQRLDEERQEVAVCKEVEAGACLTTYFGCYLRARASVLRTYLPHDKSNFGRQRTKMFWAITIPSVLPIFGIREISAGVLLLMLTVPEAPDYYQIACWMLRFKASQFVGSGLCMTVADSIARLSGFRKDMSSGSLVPPAGIAEYEPFWSILFDYVFSFLLTLVAFLLQMNYGRHANREEGPEYGRRRGRASSSSGEHDAHADVDHGEIDPTQGPLRRAPGKMDQFEANTNAEKPDLARSIINGTMIWDSACFFLSLMLLIWYLRGVHTEGATWLQARVFILGCRTIYALMMLPLAVGHCMHEMYVTVSDPLTGYNAHGACVKFRLKKRGAHIA